MAMNDPFEGIAARNRIETEALQQRGLENSAVRLALTKGMFQGPLRDLERECAEVTGHRALTCAWFADRFPMFPLRFGASVIDWMHETTIWDLFEKFLRTRLFKVYLDFAEQEALDDTVDHIAMVFRWKRRLMVLHNYTKSSGLDVLPSEGEDDESEHAGGSCLIFRGGKPPVTYAVERWASLLERVGPWCNG